MNYKKIKQEVNDFANFLRDTNIYFMPTDGGLLSKIIHDKNKRPCRLIYTDNPKIIHGDNSRVLRTYTDDLAILTNNLLEHTYATEAFKEFVYNKTISSYLKSTDINDILTVFTCFDFALFDKERVKSLEKLYIQEQTMTLICAYNEDKLDLSSNSDAVKNARFIKEWISEYSVKYGNDQNLITIETHLETILDHSLDFLF